MDELEISGKRYISAKRIAKENRYHPDYVGQLIRAGRVSGTKVGRAWYVDEASFAEYLGKERGQSLATPAQDTSSPESGKSVATDFPTSGVVTPPYIPDELVPAAAPFAIVEPPYVPEEVVSLPTPVVIAESNIADGGAPQRDGARTEQFPSKEIVYPESADVAVGSQKKVPFKTSLTYIPDNSPLFPAIQKRTKPAVEVRKDEYVVAQIAKPAHTAQPILRPKRSIWKTGFAVASVGAVAAIFFGFAFFGSLGINSVVIVEKGKPASVAFAQEKTFCFIFGNCQNSKN